MNGLGNSDGASVNQKVAGGKDIDFGVGQAIVTNKSDVNAHLVDHDHDHDQLTAVIIAGSEVG